jgi:hypothetical protein
LEEIISKNFNISENNIISVELVKVQGYRPLCYNWWTCYKNACVNKTSFMALGGFYLLIKY